jgi:hypothetical protein
VEVSCTTPDPKPCNRQVSGIPQYVCSRLTNSERYMETFGKHQGADDPKQPFRPTSSPKGPSKMKCPATYSKQCSLDDFTNKHCRPHPKQPPRGGPNQPLQLHSECRPQHELGHPSKRYSQTLHKAPSTPARPARPPYLDDSTVPIPVKCDPSDGRPSSHCALSMIALG